MTDSTEKVRISSNLCNQFKFPQIIQAHDDMCHYDFIKYLISHPLTCDNVDRQQQMGLPDLRPADEPETAFSLRIMTGMYLQPPPHLHRHASCQSEDRPVTIS